MTLAFMLVAAPSALSELLAASPEAEVEPVAEAEPDALPAPEEAAEPED